ncbi:PucR family transcriptional regulator [Sinomonas mesophila]|uniref:PucR family transcriptional regulator n=1 Tax=Sinomonas mesophila TaxID=1531955 RepID=UPI0009848724|nr:helix-turn-helix domain-containing protein [Sinomonas mesophila]
MGSTINSILADLPPGWAHHRLDAAGADPAVTRVLVLEAADFADNSEALASGAHPDVRSALVCLVGARGRAAVPAIGRLVQAGAAAVAVKGDRTPEAEELCRAAGVGLLLVAPEVPWDRIVATATSRVNDAEPQAAAMALLEEDLFALAQTTARITSSHVVIEDAANRVLAYSTVSNNIDELRMASILTRRGPREYELMLKDLGAYREMHRTRGVVRVPARPERGLRERAAIAIFAGERIMGYIWLQETGEGFGDNVTYALTGAARRAASELIRYRNQQSVTMHEDRIGRLLSGPAEAEAFAKTLGVAADAPSCLLLVSVSPADAMAEDAELVRGQLADLVALHAAAFKGSAIVGQLRGRTAVVLPALAARTDIAALRSLGSLIVADASRHLGVTAFVAVGRIVPSLTALRASHDEADAVLDSLLRGNGLQVAAIGDVETDVLLHEAVTRFASSAFRHRALTELLTTDRELAETLAGYFAASMDVTACGQAMRVHRNTVYYRVAKAERLTGLDFGNPSHATIAQLHLGLWSRGALDGAGAAS